MISKTWPWALVAALCIAAAGCGDGRDAAPPSAADALASPADAAGSAAATSDAGPSADVVHRDAIALDTHVDIDLAYATDAMDPLDADLQVNLQKMAAGGLDAAFFIVYVGQTPRTPENYARAHRDALTKFAAIHRMAEELHPDRIEIAYAAADVERIAAAGKLVAAIGVENGYSIGTDIAELRRFHALGARYFGLVHNGDNDLAHSAQPRAELGDEPAETSGVTSLGAEVVAELNRLGIMVDVSHSSKASTLDMIRLSRAPVIASHSGVRAITDHPRNLDDETLQALAQSGGVVQIVAFDSYLKTQPPERQSAVRTLRDTLGIEPTQGAAAMSPELRAAFEEGMREIDAQWPRASVAELVDHIDYAVKLAGIDHVGISSDFEGGGGIVGWNDALETPNVTRELLARGYSAQDVGKIWSGNLLRVWREVERVAAELAAAATP